MVCDGPDPPDNTPHNLSPPPLHLITNGNHHEDSDEEQNEHFGYQPLPQAPEASLFDLEDSSDEDVENNEAPTNGVPDIEPMAASLTREVWNGPRNTDPIEMDSERVQQVMSAMANFALPQASIPDWAKSVSEEQWKQTLNDKIEKIRSNR